MAPDQLAYELGIDDTCTAIEQWKATVLDMLRTERPQRARRREAKLARKHGFRTWNAYRLHLYQQREPVTSIHQYAKLKGWR